MDLTDPRSKGRSLDTRFIDRVFTLQEQEQIVNGGSPDVLVWSFWAGKETAYKILRKVHGNVTAAPRRYEVKMSTSGNDRDDNKSCISGVVRTPYDTVSIRIFTEANYIHCIGVTGAEELMRSVIWGIHKGELSEGEGDIYLPETASVEIRKLATKEIATYFQEDIENIAILRFKDSHGLGPPTVYIRGKEAILDISLSHDGQFLSYAFMPV
ncbi:MAG: 4'-phosphopantetheinyl transferase superfamily protein [Deltaproteobacteria bacterium]|nr:4'-phosphopantetheinyl transferase superfamily protein [Deltaproteobacteria bacterium]